MERKKTEDKEKETTHTTQTLKLITSIEARTKL